MKFAGRMSLQEAQMAADKLAEAFIRNTDTRGFTPALQAASPNPLCAEQSVLSVDLVTSVASWK